MPTLTPERRYTYAAALLLALAAVWLGLLAVDALNRATAQLNEALCVTDTECAALCPATATDCDGGPYG